MKRFFSRLYDFTLGLVAWLRVGANREHLYRVAGTLGALVVAAGFLTGDQVAHYLTILSGLLLLGTNAVAKRHVRKDR